MAAGERQVVVDAGAAIRLQRLERFGGELFTTSGVIAEVKDEKARALLSTLPRQLRVREPLTQDITYVKQFAKGTGDFRVLSQNDIELIALTVALHRESGGSLREKPTTPAVGNGQTTFEWAPGAFDKSAPASETPAPWNPARPAGAAEAKGVEPQAGQAAATACSQDTGDAVAGAGSPDEAAQPSLEAGCAGEQGSVADQRPAGEGVEVAGAADGSMVGERAVEETEARQTDTVSAPERETAAEPAEASKPHSEGEGVEGAVPAAEPAGDSAQLSVEAERPGSAAEVKAAAAARVEDAQDNFSDSEDGSSAGEWITAENLHHFGQTVQPAEDEAKVTCATSDYAMQNVLLQMGITPLTFDGYAVSSVRIWGLICRACFYFTRDTEKIFCPKCGHDTTVRVPIIVGQDGKAVVQHCGHTLRRKGTVYSVPKPQRGRGWKPIFAEDELKMGGRDRMMRRNAKLADKERQAKDPFNDDNGARAWYQRGTTSTGKMLHTAAPKVEAGYGRKNPNANNFRFKTTKRR